MDKKCAFLSKTRTSLSDPKLFNGSVFHSTQFHSLSHQHYLLEFNLKVVLLAGGGRRRDGDRGGGREKVKRVIGEGWMEGESREREAERLKSSRWMDRKEVGGKGRAMEGPTGCEHKPWPEPHQADRQWVEEWARWQRAQAFSFTHLQHQHSEQSEKSIRQEELNVIAVMRINRTTLEE